MAAVSTALLSDSRWNLIEAPIQNRDVHLNWLLQSDPNSLFLNYEKMRLGDVSMTQAEKWLANAHTRTDTLNSTYNLDYQVPKVGARDMNAYDDWSDNNSHANSTHFRLRMPNFNQPSRNHFNDVASPNMPTSIYKPDTGGTPVSGYFQFNQSVADSYEPMDLDLRTLNNSEQHLIFDNKDRRGTMHTLPSLNKTPRRTLNNSGNYHEPRRSIGGPLMRLNSEENSVNMSIAQNQDGFRRGALNNSLSSHSPFGRSSLFQPSKPGSKWAHTVDRKHHPKSRFGSLFGLQPAGSLHQTPNPHAKSIPQQSPFRQVSYKTPHQKSGFANQFGFQGKSPVTSQRTLQDGLFRVNSLPNIPSLSNYPSKLTDARDKKTSIFELKSITERREDENERRLSQHLDDVRESPSTRPNLFARSLKQRNSQSTSKMGIREKSGESVSNVSKGVLAQPKGSESGGAGNGVSSASNNQSKTLLKNFRSFEVSSDQEDNEDNTLIVKTQPEMIFFSKNSEDQRIGINCSINGRTDRAKKIDSLNLLTGLTKESQPKLATGNPKALCKEMPHSVKKKPSIFGDLTKISPKIKKIKIKKNYHKSHKGKKINLKIDNSKIIEQLATRPPEEGSEHMNPCGSPHPTSLFNFQAKAPGLWDQLANADEGGSHMENDIKGVKNKKILKINLQSKRGHSERMASPVSQPFSSPNPVAPGRTRFGLFSSMQKIRDQPKSSRVAVKWQNPKSLFASQLMSNRKPKPLRPYSMTPNPKHSRAISSFSQNRLATKNQILDSQLFAKSNFLGKNPFQTGPQDAPNVNFRNLLKVGAGVTQTKQYRVNPESSFLSRKLESTPPIRNANIVSSSPHELNFLEEHLNMHYDASDLFVPKTISSNRRVNDLNLSHSGPMHSKLVNGPGAHLEDQRTQSRFASGRERMGAIAMPGQAVNLQSHRLNDYRANRPERYAQARQPNPFFANQQNFPLVIPNYNQVQYIPAQANNMRNQMDPRLANGAPVYPQNPRIGPLENYHLNHAPEKLMTFLHPKGSLFQRQYEQKVFGNGQTQALNPAHDVGAQQEFTVQENAKDEGTEAEKPKKREEGNEKKSKRKRRRRRNRNKNKNQKKADKGGKSTQYQKYEKEDLNYEESRRNGYNRGNYWEEDEDREERYPRRKKRYQRRNY